MSCVQILGLNFCPGCFFVKSCLNPELIEILRTQDSPLDATQRKLVLNFAESGDGNIGGARNSSAQYWHNSRNIRTIRRISANPVAI